MKRTTALAAASVSVAAAVTLGLFAVDAARVAVPQPVATPTHVSADTTRPAPSVTAPTPSATASAAPRARVEATAPQALPASLEIPEIDVETDLEQLGLLDDGSLATPVDTDLAGWFEGGPRPGAVGPAVIAGHVSWNGDPSVFFRLSELAPGDTMTVTQTNGDRVQFEVTRVEQHPKNEFPTVAVYSNTEGPELRLITCGGDFDSSSGHFVDNIVVFAREA